MSGPIVILFSTLFQEMDYADSYKRFADFANNRGVDLRLVFGIDKYKNGLFTSYSTFKNNQWKEYNGPFKAGIVYLRSRVNVPGIEKRINNDFLENICRDKYLTYTTFPSRVKNTILLTPENISSISDLKTDRVALKPRYGANGREVQIIEKGSLTPPGIFEEEFIAQELIESSAGIPGLVTQRHELRVFIFNGEIHAAYLRLPAKNSYIANISRGAKEKMISLHDIPRSAIEAVKEIDSAFKSVTPRLYTIDIMYENNTPWIVELNDTPGMPDIAVQPFTDDYFNTLIDFLVAA